MSHFRNPLIVPCRTSPDVQCLSPDAEHQQPSPMYMNIYTPGPDRFASARPLLQLDALTTEKLARPGVAQADAPHCVCIHTPPETLPGHLTNTDQSSAASLPGLHRVHSISSIEKHYETCLVAASAVHADFSRLEAESPEVQRRLEFSDMSSSSGMQFGNDSIDDAFLVDNFLLKSLNCHEDDAQSTAASSSEFGPSNMSGKRKRGDEPQRPQFYLDESCNGISPHGQCTTTDSTGSSSRRSQESEGSMSRQTSVRTHTDMEVQTDPEICIESCQTTDCLPANAASQFRLSSTDADNWKPGLYLAIEECTVDLGEFLGISLVIGSALGTGSLAAAWGASPFAAAGAVASPSLVVTSSLWQDLALTGEPVSTAILGVALLGCCVLPTLPSCIASRREGLFDPGSVLSALRDDESVVTEPESADQIAVIHEVDEEAVASSSAEPAPESKATEGTTPPCSPIRSAAEFTSPSVSVDGGATSSGTAMEAEEARSEASTAVVASELDAALDAAISRNFAPTHYFVDNTMLRDYTCGLGYRFSKNLVDKVGETSLAPWGCIISGIDEGDGWVKVADRYLPKEVRDTPVLTKHGAQDYFVWIVDNSELMELNSDGLAYQCSKKGSDTVAVAPWGSRIYGKEEEDGWVRAGKLFLPRNVRGKTVLVKDEINIWVGMPALVTSDVHQLERSVKEGRMQWPGRQSGGNWQDMLGLVGNVTEVDLSNNTVVLDQDVGLVPIRALLGFDNWPPCIKQPRPGEVDTENVD